MRREKIKKNALAMAVCCVALLSCALCVSCYNDEYEGEVLDETDSDAISVQLRVVVKNLADGTGGYEEGTGYENYIRLTEVEGGTGSGIGWQTDYRIYFLDSDDEWIGSLSDINIIEKVGSDYTVYDILGQTAYISESDSGQVKVVMVANWGSYPNYTRRSNTQNLSTICNSTRYNALVDDEGQALLPSPENGLIPFYGICAFENVTFETGKRTTLDEDISLLRAMAKVEVVLENEDESFSDVTLHGYNKLGCCAPTDVKSQYDYVYNDWNEGYVSTLHLYNSITGQNINDDNATENTMRFVKTQDGSEEQEQYETWVAYVPEYDNSGTDFSYITVTLNEKDYTIYFAEYADGVTDNSEDERFDIHRNNLYRFYVKFNQREDNITVTVAKWNERTGSFIVIPEGSGSSNNQEFL